MKHEFDVQVLVDTFLIQITAHLNVARKHAEALNFDQFAHQKSLAFAVLDTFHLLVLRSVGLSVLRDQLLVQHCSFEALICECDFSA